MSSSTRFTKMTYDKMASVVLQQYVAMCGSRSRGAQAICIAQNANKSNNLGARGNWFAAMPLARPPPRRLPRTAPSRNFSVRLDVISLNGYYCDQMQNFSPQKQKPFGIL